VKVEWNAAKDRELWEVLSQPSKESDIDCTYNPRLGKLSVLVLILLFLIAQGRLCKAFIRLFMFDQTEPQN
jgi:hypothetical protein